MVVQISPPALPHPPGYSMHSLRLLLYLHPPHKLLEQRVIRQQDDAYRIPKGLLPSINLVFAALSNVDYS